MDPLFKVGQKITIKYRKKSENPGDYPCSYVNGMTEFAGKVATIKYVNMSVLDYNGKFSDYYDGYIYRIIEDSGEYWWSSPMFKETYEF